MLGVAKIRSDTLYLTNRLCKALTAYMFCDRRKKMDGALSQRDRGTHLSLILWSVNKGHLRTHQVMTQSPYRAARYHKVTPKPDPTAECINSSLLGRESRVYL